MESNFLFKNTRLRLSLWYAGAMGFLLSLFSIGVYEAILHAHEMTLNREIESVTGTLHDSLKPLLKTPGELEPQIHQSFPYLCIVGQACDSEGSLNGMGAIHQGNYYIRFLDRHGNLVATSRMSSGDTIAIDSLSTWQTLTDKQHHRYRQMTVRLETRDRQVWGYLQVGKSLQEWDDYLKIVRYFILVGLPISLAVVGGVAWQLSGLAMQPIYRSYRQIQQFTADAAHELRTPLAAMQAIVESTLTNPEISRDEAIDTLQACDRQHQRLSELVRDLLLLSRLDFHLTTIKRQPCCLNDIVADVAEEMAPLALGDNIDIQVVTLPDPAISVWGTESQLYRLLVNLVSNAIRYNHVGGKIKIHLKCSDRRAILQVNDTGVGIPDAEIERIFDRFYRGDRDRSRKSGGSGLGLSIVKAIVEAHGGRIEVRSIIEKGSQFEVRLPLK